MRGLAHDACNEQQQPYFKLNARTKDKNCTAWGRYMEPKGEQLGEAGSGKCGFVLTIILEPLQNCFFADMHCIVSMVVVV